MAGDSASPRVLVVDDTEAIRTIIRRVLTGAGYHVDVAASAPEAREMDPAGYDALLVDAHLGRERGTALIQALVAEDPAAARRCLLITGGKPDLVPAGVVCLTKPFRPDELITAVGALHPADSAARPEGPRSSQPPGRQPPGRQPPAAQPPAAPARGAQPPGGQPPGAPAGRPAVWPLLGLLQRLRAGERAAMADFIHDGPIQDLTAALLSVQALTRAPPGGLAPHVAELGHHLDAAAGSVRQIADDSALPLQVEAELCGLVQRRTAWLPFSPVTAEFQGTSAAPGTEAPVLAEILELALFALADLAPPSRADILVHAGETVLEILLTLTPADMIPEGAGDAAAARVALAELAQALGGTARASFGAFPWRACIRLPSRPAAGGLCPGWCRRCTICRSPSSAPA
ncbi:MAG TPA: response regulator [Streptosporangiaceae bacterium]|nr:response regulator [Streptosporangiaceae bacterium]